MSSSRCITVEFAYHRPARLEEALELLQRLAGARILAGGTDLLIQIKTGEAKPQALVQVLDIPELARFEIDRGLTIGAAVQLYRLEAEPRIKEGYTALHEAVCGLGSSQVRNMATLAGNLCNASPSADTAGPLLVLGAEAEIAWKEAGQITSKRLPLAELFTGPGQTVLKPGQLLTAVYIPQPPADSGSAFRKIGRVTLDMAKISASVYVERRDKTVRSVRVAVGGAAPRPVRAPGVEEALTGRAFSRAALERAARRVEESIAPITDVRSTAEYRREVASVLLMDTFLEAWRRSAGEAGA